MWARFRLDFGVLDAAYGLARCLLPSSRQRISEDIERDWSTEGLAITTFSVRSGFDLALQALAFPPESEVLFTALNIKGMVKIPRRLGLLPVPLDMDPETMQLDVETLRRAIGPRTRALVIAPLFGTRYDLGPVIGLAKEHGLFVFEDCAQAFAGLGYRGHPNADISMFSFGPLKFATALGGAVLVVRNPDLVTRMRAIQDGYPVSSRRQYALRLLKFTGIRLVSARWVLGFVTKRLRARGVDYEASLSDAVRGVAKLGSPDKQRKQCSAPLLAMMRRRIKRFREPSLGRRRHLGAFLTEQVRGVSLLPGSANTYHNYWAFPVAVENPAELMNSLRAEGFDAAVPNRSAAVPPPEDRPHLAAHRADRVLQHLVILPCYPVMPEAELLRQALIVRRVAKPLTMPAEGEIPLVAAAES